MNYAHELRKDHVEITDSVVSREYFRRLNEASHYIPEVMEGEILTGLLRDHDSDSIARHLGNLYVTIEALAMKYAVSPELNGAMRDNLTMDSERSGFPVWQEISALGNDLSGGKYELESMSSAEKLKSEMLREIMTKSRYPVQLQNVMARREYLRIITEKTPMGTRSVPMARLVGKTDKDRLLWRVDWSVYDSDLNLPVIYMMDVEDTGRLAMTEDPAVWSVLSRHLMAQSTMKLDMNTIARGVDTDFKRLHPLSMRRVLIGPLYSSPFTVQNENISQALQKAGDGSWILSLTTESIDAKRETLEGVFTRTVKQEYGQIKSDQIMLSPMRVFQAVQDFYPETFRGAKKYVIMPDGRVQSHK